MSAFLNFIKKDTVLAVSLVLALLSCLFIRPDSSYINYIDTDTLIMLFCLMLTVEGLSSCGFFRTAGRMLIHNVHTQQGIIASLVALCFAGSMFITNDVALITFVPLGILILEQTEMKSHICLCITLMTIAANLGSMLTPIGNPQNLYLYSVSGMTLPSFIELMLPYSLLSLFMLSVIIALRYRRTEIGRLSHESADHQDDVSCENRTSSVKMTGAVPYFILFGLCILALCRVISYPVLLITVIICVFFTDRKLFTSVDYNLLFTFLFFFIFTGNLNRLDNFHNMLISLLSGNETAVSISASQIISNVPAALLLSDYTSDTSSLIVGTNLGGLGTLVASMASLISYRQLSLKYPELKGRYLATFTVLNIIFLFFLVLFASV